MYFIFPQFWRQEVQGQGVCRACFLAPSAPFAVAFSLCLHVASSLCVCESQTSLPVCPNPSSYKDSSHLGLGPQPKNFILALITSLKTLCVYSHTLRSWGLGLQHRNLGLDTIQPQHGIFMIWLYFMGIDAACLKHNTTLMNPTWTIIFHDPLNTDYRLNWIHFLNNLN